MAGKLGRSGRRSKADQYGLHALLDQYWTKASRQKCIESLTVKAENGDMEATKLLLAYTFGKPRETVEHSGAVEIKIVDESDS